MTTTPSNKLKRQASLFIFAAMMVVLFVMTAVLLYSISGEAPDEPLELRATLIDPPLEVNDFTLASTTGDDYSLSDGDGKVRLIYFGYMTCPDFCPTTMADLQRTMGEFEAAEAEQVEVLFITVDPERDDMERMTPYVAAFDERFIGLRTDDASELQAIMSDFGVVAVKTEVESALEYLVDHTASVFMLDPNGDIITRFTYGTSHEDIAYDVRQVIAAYDEDDA